MEKVGFGAMRSRSWDVLKIVQELYSEMNEKWCPDGEDSEAEVRKLIYQKREGSD